MRITTLKSKNRFEVGDYFRKKALADLDISELAYIHLDRLHGKMVLSNCIVYSSLYDLLETAQSSFYKDRTRIYTPLLSCFAILDQIGGVYGSRSKCTAYKAGIKAALDLFGGCSKVDIEKLYALRNGLYHDGSLLSISKNGNTNVIFRLSQTSTNTITPASSEWTGVYEDVLDPFVTKINTKKFQEDVEAIVRKCSSELLNGTLKIKINDTREFFYKFLFSMDLESTAI